MIRAAAALALATIVSTALGRLPSASAPDEVAEAASALAAIPADHERGVVPPAARPLLVALEHGLRDTIREALPAGSEPLDAAAVRERVVDNLARQGVRVGPPGAGDAPYGKVVDVTVEFPEGLSDYAAATATTSVECGTDTSFYLFRRGGDGWGLAASQESGEFATIEGAQGRFRYLLRPSSDGRHVDVVTGNVNPWCVSCWQTLRLEVLRVDAEAGPARTPWRKSYYVYACDGYALERTEAGFEATFTEDFDHAGRKRGYSVTDSGVAEIPEAP